MRITLALTAALIWATVFPVSAPAQTLSLTFPVDCTLGETCFIQQTMDRDPGPQARDFTCGPMSYENHSGTDIRLPDMQAVEQGWSVLAAAPGRVRGVRDGVPDLGLDAMPDGLDCGNGVAIIHDGGWETQYCHMRMGSIAVAAGDEVEAGTVLGQIGFSGRTQFPHLHLSVRRDGQNVDPFDPSDSATCGAGNDPLWTDPVPLQPGGFLAAGFADQIPEFDAVKAGTASTAGMTRNSPALVFWASLFFGQTGDALHVRITAPDGSVFQEQTLELEKTQAELFRAIGRRTPAQGWPPGTYRGEATLRRNGDIIDQTETSVTLN